MGRERMGKRGARGREEGRRKSGEAAEPPAEAAAGSLQGRTVRSSLWFASRMLYLGPGSISPAIQFRTLQFWEAHAAAAV